MIFFRIVFYLSFTALFLFLLRREANYLYSIISKLKTGLIWIVLFSLLIFIDILSLDGMLNFRLVNFVFYLGLFWIGFKVAVLGWRQTTNIFLRPPLVYFHIFALVCLISSFFAPHIPDLPIDWSLQHAIRLQIFFMSVSILAHQKYINVISLKFTYILLAILSIRILLPLYEALLSDDIMPWSWFQISFNTHWFKWAFVSHWYTIEGYTKDHNSLGVMVNSYAFILSILFLILIKYLLARPNFYWRLVLPICFCGIILLQLRVQTAFLVIAIGLVFTLISKLKWVGLTILVIIVVGCFQFSLLNSQMFQTYLEDDTRFTIIFPSAVEGFFARPLFGYGYASGEYLYFQNYELPVRWQPTIREAHNTVLSIALNTGIAGLIPFIIGIFSVTSILFQFWMKSRFDALSTNLVILFVSSCVASLFLTDLFYIFDDTLLIRMYPFFIVLLMTQVKHNLLVSQEKK